MDDWHHKLATSAAESPGGALDAATSLEIALGRARSSLVYALELALAHRMPASGSVSGDDIWFRMGDARARVVLNRRETCIVVSRAFEGGGTDVRLAWDAARGALASDGAAGADLDELTRGAIDAVIADWRARSGKRLSAPPPTFDDEPTKG